MIDNRQQQILDKCLSGKWDRNTIIQMASFHDILPEVCSVFNWNLESIKQELNNNKPCRGCQRKK